MNRLASPRWTVAAILTLAIAMTLVVWFAPPERTMGYGIRPVYVHVAFIWTGMVGLLAVALLGLWLAVSGREPVIVWLEAAGWVAAAFLIASLLASVWAQIVNWNGIFLDEPRTQIMIRVTAIFVILQVVQRWLHWPRLRGAVMAVAAPIMLLSMRTSPLVLHPGDAVTTATSSPIQVTFGVLFVLCLAGAAWLIVFVHNRLHPRPV